jgi:hypothetical protein
MLPMMTSYEERRDEALRALEAGDAQKAFAAFRWAFEYPGQLGEDRARIREAVEIFARIASGVGATRTGEAATRLAANADDVQALYDVGFSLIDENLDGIAATFLARALLLAPGEQQIVSELVIALEGAGLNSQAVGVLLGAWPSLEGAFVFHYLLAFDSLMTCDRDEPRKQLAALDRLASNDDERVMAARIRTMLARADAISTVSALDARDLRGWHYVVTGSLLLHRSPYGLDEGMNGRYAFTQDSPTRCRAALARLRAVHEAWDRPVTCVLDVGERESTILATAAASVLGAPLRPWSADERGLVVAYDLAKLDDAILAQLQPYRAGQLLFAHATCWTSPPPITPDVVTYLHQYNESPWGERLKIDPATNKSTRAPAETAPASELASAIATATPNEDDDGVPDLDALVKLARAILPFPKDGMRPRQRTDSPVKSSRFL